MREGAYYYAIENGTCIIKPVGSITVPLCAGIDSFLSRIFNDNAVSDVVIDMTETGYIDSTNLGVLLSINKRFSHPAGKRPVIVTAGGAVEKILHEVSFDKLFDIINRGPVHREEKFIDLPGGEKTEEELRRIVAGAHFNLMSIDEKNRERFADVVSLLEEDQTTAEEPSRIELPPGAGRDEDPDVPAETSRRS